MISHSNFLIISYEEIIKSCANLIKVLKYCKFFDKKFFLFYYLAYLTSNRRLRFYKFANHRFLASKQPANYYKPKI